MRGVTRFGLLTGAGLYIAIGVLGVVLLGAQPRGLTTTDGYGVIRVAAQSSHP